MRVVYCSSTKGGIEWYRQTAAKMAVRYVGTVCLNFWQEVRYAFFVMVRVWYVGTVRLFCNGRGTVRWYPV